MDMRTNRKNRVVTRQRLLEAAGEVFAEKGFRSATVRDISCRAQANIAAINYHFGNKEKLYSSALKYWFDFIEEHYPLDRGLGNNPTGQERLRAFVEALLRSFAEDRPAWHGKLFAREMIEPTGLLPRNHFEKRFDLLFHRLREIIVQAAGRKENEEKVNLCVSSIIGQCFFFMHNKTIISRICPELKSEKSRIKRIADHIIRFSLAGLKETFQNG